MEMGDRGRLYLPIATLPVQECLLMGSDESRFNVSLIVRDEVTRQCTQTTTFEDRRAEAESNRGPSAYQPNALPLGQTGSQRGSVQLSKLHKTSDKRMKKVDRVPPREVCGKIQGPERMDLWVAVYTCLTT